MRSNFWRGEDQGGVQVGDVVAAVPHPLERFAEKDDGIRALPPGVRRREQSSDIRRSDGAEQRVCYCVQQHVTIRVPAEAFVVRQRDAADPQRNPRAELVRVKSVANSHAETLATDSHGFPRIFFLSLSNKRRRNCGRGPKLNSKPTSMSVDLR